MSEEILNEIVEEIPVEETVSVEEIIEIPQRVNPFCVISKNTFIVTDINGKKHKCHETQSNSSWGANPYGEDYAVVPDEMVQAILETKGFINIELNEDGTEIVGFTPLEIPEIPEPKPEPTTEDRIAELESQNESLNNDLLNTQLALTEIYEQLIILTEGI